MLQIIRHVVQHKSSSNWSGSVVVLLVHDSALTKHSVGMGYDVKDKKLEYQIAGMLKN